MEMLTGIQIKRGKERTKVEEGEDNVQAYTLLVEQKYHDQWFRNSHVLLIRFEAILGDRKSVV